MSVVIMWCIEELLFALTDMRDLKSESYVLKLRGDLLKPHL